MRHNNGVRDGQGTSAIVLGRFYGHVAPQCCRLLRSCDLLCAGAHFPGFDKKYGGMDWESLRLVFEDATLGGGTELMLVGIVHAQWTI